MGLTAIIGDALTDHAAHPWGLYLDGLDVIKEHATPSRFGVPIDSIEVIEAGPGAASSMSFSIDDPQLVLAFSYAARVEYWDLTNNWPVFVGRMQAPTIVSDFGEQGRRFEIIAVGDDSLLDTIIVPSLTVAAGAACKADGTPFFDGPFVQLFAGFGGFRCAGNDLVPTASTQAAPVMMGSKAQVGGGMPTTVFDGMSIRQAWETADALLQSNIPIQPMFFDLDMYGGVRFFPWAVNSSGSSYPNFAPTDWTTITIDNSPGGVLASSLLSWSLDGSPNAVTSAAYVKGTTAAATGWVAGDPSYGRRERYVTASATTGDQMLAAGYSTIGQHQSAAGRGQLVLQDFVPVNAHPGGQLIITDARQGWTAKLFTITEITKHFKSNSKQDWTITFADPAGSTGAAGPPSAARLMRSLTRGTN